MIPVLHDPYKYHAYITYCDNDYQLAHTVLDGLESRGFVCILKDRDFNAGGPIVDEIGDAIFSSRRIIMLISNDSLQDEWSKYEMMAAIDESHKRNSVNLIPVILDGTKVSSLPPPVRLLTCIEKAKEKNYIQKLADALSNKEDTWETLLPAGNVAHGMAWSYYFGYLKVILPDIDTRIREWRNQNNVETEMCQKLILLFPQSCLCKDILTDEDSRITHAGHLPIVIRNRAGTVERQYRSTVYCVNNKGEKYYFVGEYITCIQTMYEMEHCPETGLQTEDKYIQATRFYVTIKTILRNENMSKKCIILWYKDSSTPHRGVDIVQSLCNVIKKELLSEKRDSPASYVPESSHVICPSICGPDFDLYTTMKCEMTKCEPNVYRDETGKARTVEHGDRLTNIFTKPQANTS